jgi:hypothetical protein
VIGIAATIVLYALTARLFWVMWVHTFIFCS